MRKDDLALVSLRIALKSFFSTYSKVRGRLKDIIQNAGIKQKIIDSHSLEYAECYAECIVHFQHFAELSCKHFLRQDHVLLADIATDQPKVLHSLLHNIKLTADEETQIRSIEFSEALKRLLDLVKREKLNDYSSLKFFEEHKETLVHLNSLRNRVWHRGLYILDYEALDALVGQFILPFVKAVVNHPYYKSRDRIWRYQDLKCGLDPINAIIEHFKTENYDVKKVCYLKELGRAAYSKALPPNSAPDTLKNFYHMSWTIKKRRAERIASSEASLDYHSVENCPSCGARTLIVQEEHETDFDENGDPVDQYSYVHATQCELCSLSFDSELGNASTFKLTGIADYFAT